MPVAPVILVNGLPGAGKTTIARGLSRRLALPLFSKDVIKEATADILGDEPSDGRAQRLWNNELGAAASEAMWALLADAPSGAILESCWLAHVRHLAEDGLRRAGREAPLEVWCDVPFETARGRFEARYPRHPIHGALPDDDEWELCRRYAEPLGLGATLRVDTTGPVDLDAVAAWIADESTPPEPRVSVDVVAEPF
ncbi:MAG TPA: AAA family ATPase [Micromonosporaceae bacterium]|nr:AAA family ATPase [Micromonosporaceae bacterium]